MIALIVAVVTGSILAGVVLLGLYLIIRDAWRGDEAAGLAVGILGFFVVVLSFAWAIERLP